MAAVQRRRGVCLLLLLALVGMLPLATSHATFAGTIGGLPAGPTSQRANYYQLRISHSIPGFVTQQVVVVVPVGVSVKPQLLPGWNITLKQRPITGGPITSYGKSVTTETDTIVFTALPDNECPDNIVLLLNFAFTFTCALSTTPEYNNTYLSVPWNNTAVPYKYLLQFPTVQYLLPATFSSDGSTLLSVNYSAPYTFQNWTDAPVKTAAGFDGTGANFRPFIYLSDWSYCGANLKVQGLQQPPVSPAPATLSPPVLAASSPPVPPAVVSQQQILAALRGMSAAEQKQLRETLQVTSGATARYAALRHQGGWRVVVSSVVAAVALVFSVASSSPPGH